ncbi:MAG: DUF4340 domain-containing protein [Clostridia bacterium]|nr:DUF4340 domain-containing protein [Clostridia bacterium]
MKKQKLLIFVLLGVLAVLALLYFFVLSPILNRVVPSPENAYYRVSGEAVDNRMYFVRGVYVSEGTLSAGTDVSGKYVFRSDKKLFEKASGRADGLSEYFSLSEEEGYTAVNPVPAGFDLSSGEYYIYGILQENTGDYSSSAIYYERKGDSFAHAEVSAVKAGLYVFTPGYVPVDELESRNASGQYLIFPYTPRTEIQSLTVTNSHGTFAFYRDASDSFLIRGYEDVPFNAMAFSALITSAGYTLTANKICDYATPSQLAEYGLDEPQAFWVLETIRGVSYRMEIGDEHLAGNDSYYVRLAGRDSVYLLNLSNTIYNETDYSVSAQAATLLEPVEFFVSPILLEGLSNSNYYMINNVILLGEGGEDAIVYITNTILEGDGSGTSTSTDATATGLSELEMVYPAHYQVNSTLFWNAFYPIATGSKRPTGCLKLGAGEEDFETYGLNDPFRVLYFEVRAPYQSGAVTYYVTTGKFTLYFGHETENGTYPVVSSLIPDVIAEVSAEDYAFIATEVFDWISDYVFPYNIRSVAGISVETEKQSVSFTLHHTVKAVESTGTDGLPTTSYSYLLDVDISNGTSIPNAEVANFRQFYLSLLNIRLKGTLSLSEEEIAAVLSDEASRALRFSFKTISGNETVIDCYYYTSAGRRLLLCIDGKAEFYISADDVTEIDQSLTQLLKGAKVNPYDPG